MNSFKILVTGSTGQLGKSLFSISKNEKYNQWIFVDKTEFDLSDSSNMEKAIIDIKPNIIINCAAYTAVDLAETESTKCFGINAKGVKQLALLCKSNDIKLIHISTDYVYHINKKIPLVETDPTHPRGVYARSKREGELHIIKSNCTYIILRTSWIYAALGNNFVQTMIKLTTKKNHLSIVNDQVGCPTYAVDLAKAIVIIIDKLRETTDFWNEIYNFTNKGITNWYEYASTIVSLLGLNTDISPIASIDYTTAAKRPLWSVLSTDKIVKAFGLSIPKWEESLKKCLEEL